MLDQQALNVLMKSPVSQEMLSHIVTVTLKVIKCKKSKHRYPSPPSSPNKYTKHLPSLMTFISRLVRYTNVYTGTLLTTLVYLDKLRAKLPKNAEGLPCTLHRVFLACLILSAKYHNDSSPKNCHWSRYTEGLFRVEDVNLMERQLLCLLNWDLKVSNEDLISSLKQFIDPIKADIRKASKLRSSIIKQKQRNQFCPPLSEAESLSSPHYRSLSSSSISSMSSSSSDIRLEDRIACNDPSYLYPPLLQKGISCYSSNYNNKYGFSHDSYNIQEQLSWS